MADPVSFIVATAVEAAVNFGISYLFPATGPRLKDLSISAASYGVTIPQIFGTARAAGNMIWADNVVEHKEEKEQGKGGSFYNQYTYTCTFAFAFARGPIQDISRIWADGKLIYDKTGNSSGVNNSKYTFTVYYGDEVQLPDPIMEALVGEGRTPAYRGLAYILFDNFLMTDFGNRIPQFAAQVTAANPADNSTPYTDFVNLADGTSLFTNTFDGGAPNDYGPAIDYQRGYAWIRGNGPSGPGLRRYRLSDSIEDKQILGLQLDGGVSVDAVQCCGSDGSLFFVGGTTLYKLDPVSNQVVAQSNSATSQLQSGCCSVDGTAIFGLYTSEMRIQDPATCELVTTIGAPPGSQYQVSPYLTSDFCVASCDGSHIYLTSAAKGQVSADAISGCSLVFSCWDTGTPGVIYGYTAGGECWVAKFSTDSSTVIWRTQVGGLAALSGQSRIVTNKIAWAAASNAYIMDTITGELVIIEQAQYLANVGALGYRGSYGNVVSVVQGNLQSRDASYSYAIPSDTPVTAQVYDGVRTAIVCFGADSDAGTPNRIVHAGLFIGASTSLDLIVSNLLQQGGLASTDFDTSGLSSIVIDGYGFANNSDIKGILSELRQVYLFDVFESDFTLKTRVRGASVPDVTIDARCLGSSTPEVRDEWKQTRVQEADLPARITLAYMDENNDFQTGTAHYERPQSPIPTMYSRQQAALSINAAMDGTTAKNLVRNMLFSQWQERSKHNTRMPWTYAYLDPSDLMSVNFPDGRNYFERIGHTEMGADLTIITETFSQDPGAYLVNPNLVGDSGTGTSQVVAIPPPAKPFVFNGPLLRDSDDVGPQNTGYYVGAGNDGGYNAIFMGAGIFGSTSDTTYTQITSTGLDCQWGVVRGTLPPPTGHWNAVDTKTKLTIVPATHTFQLTPITDDELWNGYNPMIVGKELIQFRDAVQNSDNSWTVSYLLRGRRGTQYATDNHISAEQALAATPATFYREVESLSAQGQTRYYKAVGSGASVTGGEKTSITYQPRDLMPYAVADVRRAVTTPGSQSDITLSWSRCTRTGGGLMDGTGIVPLNETVEGYEIYILSAPFVADLSVPTVPASFVRMYTSTTPTVVYSSADQSTDSFSTPTSDLHVVIYQTSGAVGRGFPSARTIEHFRPF